MHFEIRYNNGEKVSLSLLDQQANDVWGIRFPDQKVFNAHDRTTFAVPPKHAKHDDADEHTWIAMIGLAATNLQITGKDPMQPNWSYIKETLFNSCADGLWDLKYTDLLESVSESFIYLRPYFELIDYWEALGYKPVRIK